MAVEPRKTFSGSGKPKKLLVPPPRRTSGRKPTVGEVKGIVLAQPHRSRSADPGHDGRVSAIGRLILDGQVFVPRVTSSVLLSVSHRYLQDYNGGRWGQSTRATVGASREALELPPRLSKRPATPAATRMHIATYVPDPGEPPVLLDDAGRHFVDLEEELEAAEQAIRKWATALREVRQKGEMVEKALQFAILDEPNEDWAAPFWVVHAINTGGMQVLVELYGGGA
jgi:hypothetical protein